MILSKLFKNKKAREKTTSFAGLTDSHSHILPGVDDGISAMEDSIAVLTEYERLQFSDVWLTPHIMEDVPNTTAALKEKYSELQEAYNGPVKLHLGSENMIDNLFADRLKTNDFLPLYDNMLLVETSYFSPPMNLHDILHDIMSAGFVPLLAHPERYIYMDKKEYAILHEMGVKMQLNILSLIGFYGKTAREKANNLVKSGYYSLFGSDLHRLSQCDHLAKAAHLLPESLKWHQQH